MKTRYTPRGKIEWLFLLVLITLYLVISLRHLDTLPIVYEDEAWQASVAWKLATQGILGSDMFAGFYDMQQHYFGFMPLNPLLTAVFLQFSGLGLVQVRLTSVLLGLLILLLTYGLGRRLFNAQVGLLAVAFLLLVRISSTSIYNLTGIPLLDIVRIHRYDPGVAVFGLAALHAYLSAHDKRRRGWYLLAGFLAGLSGLVHLYGAFWLVAILLLALIERVAWKDLLAIALGFCLPWAPYVLYVLANLPDWRGQTQFYAERFELLNPAWYLLNLTAEYRRYRLDLLPLRLDTLLRIGTWVTLLVVPLSLAELGWHALLRKDRAALRLFVPAVLLPILFALLIAIKYHNYVITLYPLLALAVAWGCMQLWNAARRHAILRIFLSLLLVAVLVQDVIQIAALETVASETIPYPAYIAQVRAHIPDGTRVMALHRYWIGLDDLDYRGWLVPLYQALDIYHPVPIEVALEQLDPQVILIDPAMRSYLYDPPAGDDLPEHILGWMVKEGYQLTTSVEDNTYGLMEIFIRDTP